MGGLLAGHCLPQHGNRDAFPPRNKVMGLPSYRIPSRVPGIIGNGMDVVEVVTGQSVSKKVFPVSNSLLTFGNASEGGILSQQFHRLYLLSELFLDVPKAVGKTPHDFNRKHGCVLANKQKPILIYR